MTSLLGPQSLLVPQVKIFQTVAYLQVMKDAGLSQAKSLLGDTGLRYPTQACGILGYRLFAVIMMMSGLWVDVW